MTPYRDLPHAKPSSLQIAPSTSLWRLLSAWRRGVFDVLHTRKISRCWRHTNIAKLCHKYNYHVTSDGKTKHMPKRLLQFFLQECSERCTDPAPACELYWSGTTYYLRLRGLTIAYWTVKDSLEHYFEFNPEYIENYGITERITKYE